MAQEVFDEEMVEGGNRPLLVDLGNIRIVQFDNMNLATVIHKDNVVSRKGESKGTSRSKWEVLGYHSDLVKALKASLKYCIVEGIMGKAGQIEEVLLALQNVEKNVLAAVSSK